MAFMATYDEEATDPVIEAPATPVFEADSRSGSRLAALSGSIAWGRNLTDLTAGPVRQRSD